MKENIKNLDLERGESGRIIYGKDMLDQNDLLNSLEIKNIDSLKGLIGDHSRGGVIFTACRDFFNVNHLKIINGLILLKIPNKETYEEMHFYLYRDLDETIRGIKITVAGKGEICIGDTSYRQQYAEKGSDYELDYTYFTNRQLEGDLYKQSISKKEKGPSMPKLNYGFEEPNAFRVPSAETYRELNIPKEALIDFAVMFLKEFEKTQDEATGKKLLRSDLSRIRRQLENSDNYDVRDDTGAFKLMIQYKSPYWFYVRPNSAYDTSYNELIARALEETIKEFNANTTEFNALNVDAETKNPT